ncbi:MAG: response regulator transcription factor, partial [Endozoicomonadaceae bacterium]|nr:response regulator transcription factor [Endozoicomonadaceae bacterium]
DHPLLRTAMKLALKDAIGHVDCSEAESIDVLQRIMEKKEAPDLILLDLQMPGAYGFSGLHFLKGNYPHCPVVVISTYDDIKIMVEAMQIGAAGYIPKSTSHVELKEALRTISEGGQWFTEETMTAFKNNQYPMKSQTTIQKGITSLTPQQFRILGMLGQGLLNKQVGYELNISEATVKAHVTAIFKKLQVQNRTQAVIALQTLDLEDNLDSVRKIV